MRRVNTIFKGLSHSLTPSISILLGCWMDQIVLGKIGLTGPITASAAVYFWSMYRPQSLPWLPLIMIGLYQDLLLGVTCGISPCIYLGLYYFISTQRHALILSSFFTIWGGFAFCIGIQQFLLWIIPCVANGILIPSMTIVITGLFTALIYPCMTQIFASLNHIQGDE